MKLTNIVLVCFFMLALVWSCADGGRGRADSEFVDSLLEHYRDLLYSNPMKADSVYLANQQCVTDSEAWYKLELYRGIAHFLYGDTAFMDCRQSEVRAYCDAHRDAVKLDGLYWNHRGVYYVAVGRYDMARTSYEKAYNSLKCSDDYQMTISACINIADVCFLMGQLPDAAMYYRYALVIIDSVGDEKNLVAVNTGLGRIYTELENFAEAHTFFDKVEADSKEISGHDAFFYYTSVGNCLFFEKRYPESLVMFEKAYSVAPLLSNHEFYKMQCETNIGEILLLQGKTAEAHQYIDKAMSYVNKYPDCDPSVRFYLLSLAAGLALNEDRLSDAVGLLTEAEAVGDVQIPRYMMLHYKRLQRCASLRGDWRQAYLLMKKANEYSDSLRSCITANNVNEMRFRYAKDTTLLHQRLLIAEYGEQSLRWRNYIFMSLSLVFILGFVSFGVIIVLRHRARRRMARLFDEVAMLRMDVVRNRMSPHYIFNVLSATLPKFRAYPELTKSLELLIDVLRSNLLVSGKMAETLSDEIVLVKNYVELYRHVFGELPLMKWCIADDVPMDIYVPTMCIQIPVENAFKHAFSRISSDSEIIVNIGFGDGKLVMDIVDNGDGYNPGRIKRSDRDTGTGLKVLSRTIELLNMNNKERIVFGINNLEAPEHGTCVHLSVPQRYDFSLVYK